MTHWRTARQSSGDNQLPGLHISAGAHAEPNLLAGTFPLNRRNLAVVRDSSFLHQHELNPIEPFDPRLDHREFAAYVMLGVFLTLFFGIPLAIAVAMLEWS